MKRLLEILLSYRKTKLPTGLASYNEWANSVISLCRGIPNNPSTRFTLATHIAMLKDSMSIVSKQHFVALLHISAAKQVAYYQIQEAKAEQEAANVAEAEQTAKLTTAQLEVVEDVRPQAQG